MAGMGALHFCPLPSLAPSPDDWALSSDWEGRTGLQRWAEAMCVFKGTAAPEESNRGAPGPPFGAIAAQAGCVLSSNPQQRPLPGLCPCGSFRSLSQGLGSLLLRGKPLRGQAVCPGMGGQL